MKCGSWEGELLLRKKSPTQSTETINSDNVAICLLLSTTLSSGGLIRYLFWFKKKKNPLRCGYANDSQMELHHSKTNDSPGTLHFLHLNFPIFVCTHMEAKGGHQNDLLNFFPTSFLGTASLIEPEVALSIRLANQQGPQTSWSLPPSMGVIDMCHHSWLLHGSWGFKYKSSGMTLATEPTPRPFDFSHPFNRKLFLSMSSFYWISVEVRWLSHESTFL